MSDKPKATPLKKQENIEKEAAALKKNLFKRKKQAQNRQKKINKQE